ncbi:hypothetical protein WICPIJ_009888 [Wickerhamomyces pijperi]|uniref:Uncharacterized protein n=1 Tax=Wickerhamomyces pijperi TaxID=599730 RepID=A0A9P8PKW5_WICPI|nr:hypothetical protein WICPIJ_009888 [Wickerhamomyces pijperi]
MKGFSGSVDDFFVLSKESSLQVTEFDLEMTLEENTELISEDGETDSESVPFFDDFGGVISEIGSNPGCNFGFI